MRFTMPVPPEILSSLSEEFSSGNLSNIPQLMVDVDVSGRDEIMRNINILSTDMVEAASAEAHEVAQKLYDTSRELVPFKSGDLHGSAFIHEDEDGPIRGYSVGYDALTIQYAWYVHEVPAEHYSKPGTQHHFLSDPADKLKDEYPDVMANGLREAISRSRAVSHTPRLVKKR